MIYFTFSSISSIYLHNSKTMIFILHPKVTEDVIFHTPLKELLMEKVKKVEMPYLTEQKVS